MVTPCLWGGGTDIKYVEARDAVQQPAMHRVQPPPPAKNDLAPTVNNSKVKKPALEVPGNLPEETGQRVSNRWRYSRWDVRTVYPVKAMEPRGWPPFSYSYKRHPENQLGTGLNCAFHIPTVGLGEGLGLAREVLHPLSLPPCSQAPSTHCVLG